MSLDGQTEKEIFSKKYHFFLDSIKKSRTFAVF